MRLDERELATVLAALRLWQHRLDTGSCDMPADQAAMLEEVQKSCGAVEPLGAAEIDDLCFRLNSEADED